MDTLPKMTKTLQMWLVIARSPMPLTAAQIRAKMKMAESPSPTLNNLKISGFIKFNVEKQKMHYQALHWHGLTVDAMKTIA